MFENGERCLQGSALAAPPVPLEQLVPAYQASVRGQRHVVLFRRCAHLWIQEARTLPVQAPPEGEARAR